MTTVAAYDLIQRKLIINNPFKFFYELKYHTVEEVYKSLKITMDYNETAIIFEEILKIALSEKSDWKDLIANSKGIKINHYLTNVDMCLRALVKNNYIECNYRTKFDVRKHILDTKIVDLNILDNGKLVLNQLEVIRKIDLDSALKKCVEACSLYVSQSNILELSRNDLINNFTDICNEISGISIIDFNYTSNKGIIFNYYEGQVIVNDFEKLKLFVNDNNNFELERKLKVFFHESTLSIIDLKIIINALKTESFDSVYTFMKEDTLLSNLAYLTNAEYVRLDLSYSYMGDFPMSINIQVHSHVITELGNCFYDNDNIFKTKDSEMMLPEFVKALQVGVKQKDFLNYFKTNCFLKDLIVFENFI